MVTREQEVISSEQCKKECPICHKKLTIMTEDGKHNFVPHLWTDKRIVDICIKCKVNAIAKKR